MAQKFVASLQERASTGRAGSVADKLGFTPVTAWYSAWLTSYLPIENPRVSTTCVCGPSFAFLPGSVAGLPIVNVPAGIETSSVASDRRKLRVKVAEPTPLELVA